MAPPVCWYEAPDVQEVAERLIPLYHAHLLGYEIRCLFRSRSQHKVDKEVWAKAHLVTGMAAYFAQRGAKAPDSDCFVLEVSRPVWEQITLAQREALVDHELEHFKLETDDQGNISKYLQPHDIEEFESTVARHGAWKPDVVRFAQALSAGPEAFSPSDALVCPAPDEIGELLAEVRKSQEADVGDILRRARGR